MKKSFRKEAKLRVEPAIAFEHFVSEFQRWWPREYTWSGNSLVEIYMGLQKGEFCSEIGPDGFRADWGRITRFNPPVEVVFNWQIGPNREPVPDPANASLVSIQFLRDPSGTKLVLEHEGFERYGQDGDAYLQMMKGERGWNYILKKFSFYAENS